MIKKVYAIHDSAVGAYLPPFFMTSNGEALRAFAQSANDSSSQFNASAKDFTLFEIGTYDDLTGHIKMTDVLIPLGTAIEFLNESKPVAA